MGLSLDGKRLYVTSSLFSPWDKQFYPDMCSKGSMMFIIDCDTENGGMQLNNDFCVDARNPMVPPLLTRCATPEVTAPATSMWPTWTRLQRCRSSLRLCPPG